MKQVATVEQNTHISQQISSQWTTEAQVDRAAQLLASSQGTETPAEDSMRAHITSKPQVVIDHAKFPRAAAATTEPANMATAFHRKADLDITESDIDQRCRFLQQADKISKDKCK